MKSPTLVLVGTFAALALLGACEDDDDGDATNAQDDHGGSMEFDREVTVEASDELRFDPDTIRVTAGESVRLELHNEENSQLHDFSVPSIAVENVMSEGAEHHEMEGMDQEFAMHVAAEAGGHGALIFTATEPGEYEFFCSVPGHRQAGMRGTIIVEPA